jgi:hypothetical protein
MAHAKASKLATARDTRHKVNGTNLKKPQKT